MRRRFHHALISKRKNSEALPMQLPKHTTKTRRAGFLSSPDFFRLRRTVFFILITGIVLGLIYVVFLSSFFTATKISIDKNGNAVATNLLEPFLNRLKGKNLLFLNTSSVIAELEQTFRNEILMVKIKKSYPHQIVVQIIEYPAIVNFKVITRDITQKFVVNQIGFAILENTEIKNLPNLVLFSDKPMRARTMVIDQSKLTMIADAFKQFTDTFGIKIIEGEWKKTERELRLKTEKNFTVWLDLTAEISQQILKLKRALSRLDIYREPIEYIDLRISSGDNEKVIFKRRG